MNDFMRSDSVVKLLMSIGSEYIIISQFASSFHIILETRGYFGEYRRVW